MQTIIPPYLKQGDTIAIVASARWVSQEQLQPALETIHAWGFKTKVGKYVHEKNFQLAGTDVQRAEDFQNALDDDEVKAILIARGGYGTVRVIDRLDFSRFVKKPKWICGYSDVTVLHSYLSNMNIASIHCTMPVSFHAATAEAIESLRLALTGELKSVQWNDQAHSNPDSYRDKISIPIAIGTKLVGGNLSVLISLLGSNCQPDHYRKQTADCILFLEDVSEYLYHIDRMMMALKRSGMLDNVSAIVVGGLTEMKDNTKIHGFAEDNPWGFSAEEIIQRMGDELNIPVLFGFPAGHQNDNRAFYLGRNVSIEAKEGNCKLIFQD